MVIIGCMLSKLGLDSASRLYSTALLLRTGGYFLRLIMIVDDTVEKNAYPLGQPASVFFGRMERHLWGLLRSRPFGSSVGNC